MAEREQELSLQKPNLPYLNEKLTQAEKEHLKRLEGVPLFLSPELAELLSKAQRVQKINVIEEIS